MDVEKLMLFFIAMSASESFSESVVMGNAEINSKISNMTENMTNSKLDDIYECNTGKKIEIDSPIN